MSEPEKELTLQKVLLIEYDACREGLRSFDQFMFRVRQWNATATAVLAAAAVQYSIKLWWIAIGLNIIFWFSDSMQKSLQMILIERSRHLEVIINNGLKTGQLVDDDGIDYKGICIGKKFKDHKDTHIRDAINRLWDRSLFPFYMIPIVGCLIGLLIQAGKLSFIVY